MLSTASFEILETKSLDHLPLVGACMRYLEIRETIDGLIPPHSLNHVTPGECVEALVLSILTGQHALYKVSEVLSQYDTSIIFQREVDPQWFHDNRLGNALDDMWAVGLDKLYSGIISTAIIKYSLELSRLHFDTTSISLFGAYEGWEEGPWVSFGYSKDHRPDLKQLLFGMTVTGDGGVPITGRITSGSTSDSEENRFNLTSLRPVVPDLTKSILVADSKFFSGSTLELAYQENIPFVTLVPKTVGLREELVKEEGDFKPLLTRPGRHKGEIEEYKGFSAERAYRYKSSTGEEIERTMRFLVVESTVLSRQKAKGIERAILKEKKKLSKLAEKVSKRIYSCPQDAEKEAQLVREKTKLLYHELDIKINQRELPVKRERRGRPAKGEEAPTKRGWTVGIGFSQNPEKIVESKRREGRFVLATSILDRNSLPDEEILKTYKGQSSVETNFKWAKNPAAVAPIFLDNPKRIAALGFIYLVALMIYTLMERQIRKVLKGSGKKIPGNKGLTDNPTGQVLFKALRGIAVVSFSIGSNVFKKVTNLTEVHRLIITLFNFDLVIYQPLTKNTIIGAKTS